MDEWTTSINLCGRQPIINIFREKKTKICALVATIPDKCDVQVYFFYFLIMLPVCNLHNLDKIPCCLMQIGISKSFRILAVEGIRKVLYVTLFNCDV